MMSGSEISATQRIYQNIYRPRTLVRCDIERLITRREERNLARLNAEHQAAWEERRRREEAELPEDYYENLLTITEKYSLPLLKIKLPSMPDWKHRSYLNNESGSSFNSLYGSAATVKNTETPIVQTISKAQQNTNDALAALTEMSCKRVRTQACFHDNVKLQTNKELILDAVMDHSTKVRNEDMGDELDSTQEQKLWKPQNLDPPSCPAVSQYAEFFIPKTEISTNYQVPAPPSVFSRFVSIITKTLFGDQSSNTDCANDDASASLETDPDVSLPQSSTEIPLDLLPPAVPPCSKRCRKTLFLKPYTKSVSKPGTRNLETPTNDQFLQSGKSLKDARLDGQTTNGSTDYRKRAPARMKQSYQGNQDMECF